MIRLKKLENKRVRLELLDQGHHSELINIALEKDLLMYSPQQISSENYLTGYIGRAVEEYQQGISLPFAIYDKLLKGYAGSTRFGKIDHYNKVLHIGWTWIGKDFQGTGLNANMKYLMLNYAFEELNFNKVEFRIDERNIRSRRAVEKIGARLEGILRKNVVMSDGFIRNSCCYGILITEWPEIKQKLEKIINQPI